MSLPPSQLDGFSALVANSRECILVVDADLRIAVASPAVEHILGIGPDEVVGSSVGAGMTGPHRAELLDAYREVLHHPEVLRHVEVLAPRPDGTDRWVDVVISNHLADPQVGGLVANLRDVTDRKQLEAALQRQATHDPLTGLPNRVLLFERVERAAAGQRGHGARHSVALLLIDIDGFKAVNDALGHLLGDEILVEVARRITQVVRPGDTVARFGGDEFVVLCERLDHAEDAVVIANRIDQALRAPLHLQEREFQLRSSIGISYADPEAPDPLAVLHDADAAMYLAKSVGPGNWVVFDDELRARAERRQRAETALRRTLDGSDLVLHYQPVVALGSGRITGVEALVRWRHDDRLVPPSEFVPIAEETGLIVPIGAWVIRTACMQVAQWQQLAGYESLRLSVNVSARQIHHPSFASVVAAVADGSALRRGSLWLEITESLALDDLASASERLGRLSRLGARLSLDDFGTGYSSLSYLRRLPVDAVKLDRSFVAGIGVDPEDTAIVSAVVELAAALGKESVAEGVETAEQCELLRALGCGYGQGYLFSRPVPAEELRPMLLSGAPAWAESDARP